MTHWRKRPRLANPRGPANLSQPVRVEIEQMSTVAGSADPRPYSTKLRASLRQVAFVLENVRSPQIPRGGLFLVIK